MAWDISSNFGSATVATGGTDAPASGTVETFIISNPINVPAAASATQTQFRIVDAAMASNAALAEVILVTNINGASWTVMRGAEPIGANGTTPVAHAANWQAIIVATGSSLGNMRGLEPADVYNIGNAGSVAAINMPGGYSVYEANLLSGQGASFVLPYPQGGEHFQLRTTNASGTFSFVVPVIQAAAGSSLTWNATVTPTYWNGASSAINRVNFLATSASVIEALPANTVTSPLEVVINNNAFGGSDFTTDPWMHMTNPGYTSNGSGITFDFYEYDGATRMLWGPNNFANSKGFVIEYAPAENILIFGAVYGGGQYIVNNYIDGSNVWHFPNLIATDGEPWVVVNAPTAGNYIWHMPFGGTYYKKLMLLFQGYENDTASNFSHDLSSGGYGENYLQSFSYNATVSFNNTGLTVACSGTTVTVNTTNSVTTYSGLVVIEGY